MGEEIIYQFEPYSNEELLLRFNKVENNNPYDFFKIILNIKLPREYQDILDQYTPPYEKSDQNLDEFVFHG